MPARIGYSCDLAHKLTSARSNNRNWTSVLDSFRDNTGHLPLAYGYQAEVAEKGNVYADHITLLADGRDSALTVWLGTGQHCEPLSNSIRSVDFTTTFRTILVRCIIFFATLANIC